MGFDLQFDYEPCFIRHPSLNRADIAELKTWVKNLDSSSNVPRNLTDKQLLLFYHACMQVMDKTKTCIKNYYRIKNNHPEHFDNRDPHSEVFLQLQEVQEHLICSKKTDDGCVVLIHGLYDSTVEKYNYAASCKWATMSYDAYVNEEGPDNGIITIFDLKGSRLGHIPKISIGYMAKYINYLQEGLNGRINTIHVFNVVYLFDIVMNLMKPFMRPEVKDMIVLHRSNMDWEAFYRDYVPKKCLPSNYGGDLPDAQTIHKQNTERVIRNIPYFDGEEKQRHTYLIDKKKKPNLDINMNKLVIEKYPSLS